MKFFRIAMSVGAFVGLAAAASPPSSVRNFVACPILRDTQTVPCWLAEYDGELYYLGIQTDVSAEWSSPLLGHRVLVEGTLAPNKSRVCGGIVLQSLHTSVFQEPDAACDTAILPAEERYTVPFAPRGPGPSKGSLAFDSARPQAAAPGPPFTARQFVVPYEFNWPWVTGKTSRFVQQAVRFAQTGEAERIEVVGRRGATLLSNGKLLTEDAGIAERRAKQVASLLTAVGIDAKKIEVRWREEPESANGTSDFAQRRVSIDVIPAAAHP